jgi:hypothetical protein
MNFTSRHSPSSLTTPDVPAGRRSPHLFNELKSRIRTPAPKSRTFPKLLIKITLINGNPLILKLEPLAIHYMQNNGFLSMVNNDYNVGFEKSGVS